jgi:hypothetical protein
VVLNEYLNIVTSFATKIKVVMKCHLVDHSQQLVTAGVDGCHLIQLRIKYKYDPQRAILLDPHGNTSIEVTIDAHRLADSDCPLARKHPQVRDFDGYLHFKENDLTVCPITKHKITPWVKGMHVDERQKFLCCWTDTHILYLHNFDCRDLDCQTASLQGTEEERLVSQLAVLQQQKQQLEQSVLTPICVFTDLTSTDDCITEIMLVGSMHYLVVGTHKGKLRVFKWDRKTVQKQFMHEFQAHTKAIATLNPCRFNENYTASASLDGNIKLWCLEKMIEIYSFPVWSSAEGGLGEEMERITLIDDRIYALFLKGHTNAIEIG